MFKRIRSERGFTLVELLVVLAVLAILIAIVVPNLAGITGGARRAAAETELDTVQAAMDSMMSKYEAVSVMATDPPSAADYIKLNDPLTLTRIYAYDTLAKEDKLTSIARAWLLRTNTHGKYTWTINGQVYQVEYE